MHKTGIPGPVCDFTSLLTGYLKWTVFFLLKGYLIPALVSSDLFWQSLCVRQDGAYSLCLLNVLNALRQVRIECLWEQEGHWATEHCYATVRHLRQRPPHIIQQEHKWGQRPTEASHEGGVSHPILPGKVGDCGSVEYPKKEMGTSFISDLAKKIR